jgi:FtsH-binding integral membrane protein
MEDLMNAPVTPVAESAVDVRLTFLKRVYAWMTGGIIMTAVGAAISIESGLTFDLLIKPMQTSSGFARLLNTLIVIAVWMGLAYLVQKVRHKPMVNVLAYVGYALYTGFVISGLILVAMFMAEAKTGNPGTYIYQALGLTVAVFVGLTATAWYSKKDFSMVGRFASMGLVGLISIGVMNIFIQSTMLSLIYSFVGVMVFSAYVLYDTQKVMKTYPANEHVAASMVLFTDFVMLFYHMLLLLIHLQSD